MRVWPNSGVWSVARLCVLLAGLAVCGVYAAAIFQVKRADLLPLLKAGGSAFGERVLRSASAGRFAFNGNEPRLEGAYLRSLVNQYGLGRMARRYYAAHGRFPTSTSDLLPYGLAPADAVDPWGRPYRIHSVSLFRLMIQSTGPSGVNRCGESPPPRPSAVGLDYYLAGDNLCVVYNMKKGGSPTPAH